MIHQTSYHESRRHDIPLNSITLQDSPCTSMNCAQTRTSSQVVSLTLARPQLGEWLVTCPGACLLHVGDEVYNLADLLERPRASSRTTRLGKRGGGYC